MPCTRVSGPFHEAPGRNDRTLKLRRPGALVGLRRSFDGILERRKGRERVKRLELALDLPATVHRSSIQRRLRRSRGRTGVGSRVTQCGLTLWRVDRQGRGLTPMAAARALANAQVGKGGQRSAFALLEARAPSPAAGREQGARRSPTAKHTKYIRAAGNCTTCDERREQERHGLRLLSRSHQQQRSRIRTTVLSNKLGVHVRRAPYDRKRASVNAHVGGFIRAIRVCELRSTHPRLLSHGAAGAGCMDRIPARLRAL